MKIARVEGTVVSTIQHEFFDHQRLLVCDVIDPGGEPTGEYAIAVDVVDAGVGETVLLIDEGSSARQLFDVDTGPIRAVVVGIVDEVSSESGELQID
jgi:ethanolamine utilization protein EutN